MKLNGEQLDEMMDLIEFRRRLKDKGQVLSKPKANKLIDLLMMELDAQNLDDNGNGEI